MTTGEGWTAAVRDRLAPGRLLPLGAAEGAWITERAVREVLGRAASAVRGVVPGRLRIGPADAADDPESGAVIVTASFGAVARRPLPELVGELRAALLTAAEDGLGLVVGAVDLRVAELLDTAPEPDAGAAPPPGPTSPATDDPVALAALGVTGVAAMTDTLGPPVRRTPDEVRVEVAVTAGARPLDVARALRATVTALAPEGAAVTVVVSDLR
ncbi:hypothetical protein [Streptomyces sp. NBC_00691]|uniref:hypothetical protein n=1 Tax=Streptomyces sp. NBC_00691 TaxID=2903671 RepID=UPI002E301074|nr:hypothetical protein [Streptomyces sp. NBC_00691]